MSINAVNWALQQPLRGCQKFVLIILAYHADDEGKCWPGLELISKECGISRATVITHINEIALLQLVTKEKRYDERGYRRSTLYRLNLSYSIKNQRRNALRRNIPRIDPEGQSLNIDTPNVQNSDGNIIESSLEQKTENPTAKNEIQEIFEYWQHVLNHKRALLDKKRSHKIAQALKHYTIIEIKQAIEGCAKTPYNMGENKQNQRFDDIELILRDASHIERFINNANSSLPIKNKSICSISTSDPMMGVGHE